MMRLQTSLLTVIILGAFVSLSLAQSQPASPSPRATAKNIEPKSSQSNQKD